MSCDDESELSTEQRMAREGLSAEEHAREAEKLLAGQYEGQYAPEPDELLRAQVHATLAIARTLIATSPAVPR